MRVYKDLQPYDDAVEGLRSLAGRYKLVALSNGEQWYLEELLGNNVPIRFDAIISVDQVGAFKPAPGIYRKAIQHLDANPKDYDGRCALFRYPGRPSLRASKRPTSTGTNFPRKIRCTSPTSSWTTSSS